VRNYKFAFYATEKARSQRFGSLLAAGARKHGDIVEFHRKDDYTKPLEGFDGCGNLGLSRAAKTLTSGYLAAGKHYLFFDKGYFIRNEYWRVSVDAWQPLAYFQRFKRAADRWRRLRLPLQDPQEIEQEHEAPILFAGACQNYSNFCDLGNVNDYNLSVLQKLRHHTDRPIIYRPNPSWYKKHNDEFRPIHEQVKNVELSTTGLFASALLGTHLLVTHGTGAGVTAIQHGVPSMVLGGGIAAPLSMGPQDWKRIETPWWPDPKLREQFFNDLAYCQWTSDELRSGDAWAELRLILAYLDSEHADTSAEDTIEQYRIMHKSPKYFRGISTVTYRADVFNLINETNSKTILDYGSGKGEQYKPPHSLGASWGKVSCYDPGVPAFSVLPNGKFDGVICCDVLEHVPEDVVDDTLKQVFSKARNFVFLVITTVLAKKVLPDGRNCHITVKPSSWWDAHIRALAPSGVKLQVIYKGEDHD
jgi:hypothetical protein